MARVTVERILDKCVSRFELAVLISYRAHAIACGSNVAVNTSNKFAVAALREIEQGKIDVEELKNTVIEKYALESKVNTAKNSFIINDYSVKDENNEINNSFEISNEAKQENKKTSLNISKDFFA